MELSSQGEIPIPINTSYGGGVNGHMIHHDYNHIILQNPSNMQAGLGFHDHDHGPYKKVVRYKECLKNHAAAMGGNATDGCGEFMPSGEEGTIEAFNCSVCHCHRNFHRKEVEGEPYHHFNRLGRKFILGYHENIIAPDQALGNILPSRTVAPQQMIMPYLLSESDEQEEAGGSGMVARPPHLLKRRFRTKCKVQQKEQMLNLADKVGWKIQKREESVVQQFCQEIGVKRRALKVWMHNNKHNLAKKNPPTN